MERCCSSSLGIVATLAFAATAESWAPACWLSRNSLLIYGLHPLVLVALSGVAKLVVGVGDEDLASWPWAALRLLLTLALLVPVVGTVNRFLPAVTGAARRA